MFWTYVFCLFCFTETIVVCFVVFVKMSVIVMVVSILHLWMWLWPTCFILYFNVNLVCEILFYFIFWWFSFSFIYLSKLFPPSGTSSMFFIDACMLYNLVSYYKGNQFWSALILLFLLLWQYTSISYICEISVDTFEIFCLLLTLKVNPNLLDTSKINNWIDRVHFIILKVT